MRLLKLWGRNDSLLKLPYGSFTVDRSGEVLTRTLPSSFPEDLVKDLADKVLSAFHEAADVHLPLSQLVVEFPSLKISARELRGGAMIFLMPKTPFSQSLHT